MHVLLLCLELALISQRCVPSASNSNTMAIKVPAQGQNIATSQMKLIKSQMPCNLDETSNRRHAPVYHCPLPIWKELKYTWVNWMQATERDEELAQNLECSIHDSSLNNDSTAKTMAL